MNEDLISGVLIFIIWFLNLELNPGLGNIWYRTNVNNEKSFTFVNVFNILKSPFTSLDFWSVEMFDVNIVTFVLFFIVIILI